MSESPERAHSERTRVSLGFPQDRREVPLATGISGATVIESADSIARAIETPSS